MPWLIDGNNLLGLSPERQAKDPDARARLVRRLAAFVREKRTRALVVFDGEPGADVPRAEGSLGDLGIVFSGRRSSADSRILEILDAEPDPAGVVLVTSDRALGDRARQRRVRIVTSPSFRRTLEAVPGARESEKALSAEEVAWWEAIFRSGKLGP